MGFMFFVEIINWLSLLTGQIAMEDLSFPSFLETIKNFIIRDWINLGDFREVLIEINFIKVLIVEHPEAIRIRED